MKTKISLIITTYNEENSIGKLIKSIVSQTKTPDEVIIVDGKSIDKTVDKIYKAKLRYKQLNVKLIVKKGNRSVGRNEAIKNAKGDIILVSDAGCVLDSKWVENIIEKFNNKKIDIVAGFYIPTGKSVLQKCIAAYTSVMPDKLNELDFLPSSRSIGFRKYAWEKVNGYPENLNTCEDLVFAKNLKKAGFRFKIAKNAIVFWEQKNSLREALIQFFNYAKGDGKARYFREQTPFLFLRYFFFTYLIFLNLFINSSFLKLTTVFIFILYIVWAIKKNYRYVKNYKAIYYLPILQLLSDIAVLLGTTIGVFSCVSLTILIKNVFSNKILLTIMTIYIFMILYVIKLGIPNLEHPFTYHMDEWHFSQAIRTFFNYGTTTMSGSANIPLYHVVSSCFILALSFLLKLVDPFVIRSTLDNLFMQQRLFEILRFHTLLYGVLTIVIIYQILKKYIGYHPNIFTSFFIFSPIWLSLSNYYKYDIVLTFWISLTLYFIFKFAETKNNNNFIFASISCGLALSTKFTAVPLFFVLICSFLIFQGRKNLKYLLIGSSLVIFTFIFFGIPDVIFGKGNYQELIYSTLIIGPKHSAHLNIGQSSWVFLITKQFPSIFGYILFYIFLIGFSYLTICTPVKILKKKFHKHKIELFLLVSFIIFLIPSLSFGIEGGGNRALVLLPFIVLIASVFIRNIHSNKNKYIISVILVIGLFLNMFQSYSWYITKLNDPRKLSSRWMLKNLPKNSEIGIENIPIYQMLPDVVLKEYYFKQMDNSFVTNFNYSIVNEDNKVMPEYVIVTNDFDNVSYINNSPKNKLMDKLNNLGYERIKVFNANLKYYNYFSDKILLITTNIVPVPVTISIYKK